MARTPDEGLDWGNSFDDLIALAALRKRVAYFVRVLGRADELGIDLPPVLVSDQERPHTPRICNWGAASLLGGLFVAGWLSQPILLLIDEGNPARHHGRVVQPS
jgi:hypothetical protein